MRTQEILVILYFNSHPHEEDDSKIDKLIIYADISTHILTKRMTKPICRIQPYKSISTHILTKRMTFLPISQMVVFTHFNSHPHEEDDLCGSRTVIS